MHYLKSGFSLLLLFVCLSLAGCGGSSSGSGTPADPMAAGTSGSGTGTTPITAQDPKVNLSVLPDRQEIDANIGTVLLTAKLFSSVDATIIDPVTLQTVTTKAGDPIPNAAVTFTVLAGPGTISYTTPVTDKNGASAAVLTTGNVNYTTNVIIEASTTVAGNIYRAYTSVQIVRGSGVIMFQSNILEPFEKEVNPATTPAVSDLQLIPFKVTDSNGNPRVGVPVTMYVYSINPTKNPSDVTIDYLVPTTIEGSILGPNPEPNQQTITTDSAGMGIFNVSTTIVSPPAGSFTAVTVVFKAVTNDAIPVTAYVGRTYSLTSSLPTLTIAPSAASFGTGTDISFAIAGGIKPYTVSSNNTGRVTATLQADGTTVLAHLVDATAWTGAVTISVVDSAGQTVSATVTR